MQQESRQALRKVVLAILMHVKRSSSSDLLAMLLLVSKAAVDCEVASPDSALRALSAVVEGPDIKFAKAEVAEFKLAVLAETSSADVRVDAVDAAVPGRLSFVAPVAAAAAADRDAVDGV